MDNSSNNQLSIQDLEDLLRTPSFSFTLPVATELVLASDVPLHLQTWRTPPDFSNSPTVLPVAADQATESSTRTANNRLDESIAAAHILMALSRHNRKVSNGAVNTSTTINSPASKHNGSMASGTETGEPRSSSQKAVDSDTSGTFKPATGLESPQQPTSLRRSSRVAGIVAGQSHLSKQVRLLRH
ncbi:hypothetical protein IAQ61_003978 [Plenodomus lingam]|uniref:uncharacterized protein n=1 Tax=Leptosphaeria maculans TaxID=5022 RepID=UPI00332BA843|nr:hypothetical protein IAQ61_003978 [Plenodomus lingam]